jgi:4a-hydroxytetrahydrobiopterin dehydratase
MRLADRHCEKCTPGTPTLSDAEIVQQLADLPGWELGRRDGRPLIRRTYRFRGFMPGVTFVNRIAPIAEAEGHHPDVLLSYGSVTVELTTHVAGGVTENDLILAAKIDQDESPKS